MSCHLFNNENAVIFIVGESPEELAISRVFNEPIQMFLFKFSGLFPSSKCTKLTINNFSNDPLP